MSVKIVEHNVLGRLTYFNEYEWWETQVEFRPGCLVNFRLSTWTGSDPKVNVPDLFFRGVDYLEWARQAEPVCRQRVADKLLECYNDTWASEDEPAPMSCAEFVEKITLTSVVLHTDGGAYWYYADGDLFAGHWIEVRAGVNREFSHVGLAG